MLMFFFCSYCSIIVLCDYEMHFSVVLSQNIAHTYSGFNTFHSLSLCVTFVIRFLHLMWLIWWTNWLIDEWQEQSPSEEANCSQLVKCLALYRTCRIYKSPPLIPILSQINAIHALISCCFKVQYIVGHCRAVFVAAPSKAWVCGRLLAEIAGSNPAGGHGYHLLSVLPVLSGKGLCHGPITFPEES